MEEDILDEKSVGGDKVVYGGFWTRFVAVLIDGMILLIPGVIVSYLVENNLIIKSIIDVLIGIVYYVQMESSSRQATIGKQLMNLKVTDIDYQRITPGKAFSRYFVKQIGGIITTITFFTMIGADFDFMNPDIDAIMPAMPLLALGGFISLTTYLMAAFDARKRGLHDRIAKTYVIMST